MSPLNRLARSAFGERDDMPRLLAVMSLFFLVVCSVGILRPIKNALALDGLAETDFYKVYFVSAAVVLAVPAYNQLAQRLPWRTVNTVVALFFASNLVIFRLIYREGSAIQGMLFYGWYDLFAAVLVTQFFMATQRFFNARESKRAYPVVIAGGALGATLGGAITGFFAQTLGTPNLTLVAAVLIAVFGLALPFAWPEQALAPRRSRAAEAKLQAGELRALAGDPQVRLIAVSVLITVLVKQLVDYQFNTLSEQVYQTRDAVSAFQGKFNAATQWLPMVVVFALRPLLKRWGVGAAVLLLPVAMLGINAIVAATWALWAATAAKAADTSLRYSAERAGREILYVPISEEIKLKAKAYIDVAIEKGIGKAASAVLILVFLQVFEYRWIPFATIALAGVWLAVALAVRREYARALARSIEGRFASLSGLFAGLSDASTMPVLRQALGSEDALQAAFALDLLDRANPGDVAALHPELRRLLEHPTPEIRERALDVLVRQPELADCAAARTRLSDPAPAVREAAVRLLYAADPDRRDELVQSLLGSPDAGVRSAALACLARGEIAPDHARAAAPAYFAQRRELARGGDAEARVELALAAGTLEAADEAVDVLRPFLADADPRVASAALRSAGLLGHTELFPQLVDGLRSPGTREAARDALALQGPAAIPILAEHLMDESGDAVIRRTIPSVLARIPAQATVDTLLRLFLAPETDQLLDFRTLKGLNKLRSRHPELSYPPDLVLSALRREVEAGRKYAAALASLEQAPLPPAAAELARALREGWRERREGAFRCLGLLHPPEAMYRCYLAVIGGDGVARANALEWLEHSLGHTFFKSLAPVLPEGGTPARPPAREAAVLGLIDDDDAWVSYCARCAAAELAAGAAGTPGTNGGSGGMELIEKVFLLQRVDLLQDARSAHVALLASIAEEVQVQPGTALIRQGEPTDAMYVVIRGAVELRGMGEQWLVAQDGTSFGTWALIDEAASVVGAVATKPTRLLRIARAEFYDLLADHPELALGLLQGLARRVRTLVA